MSIGFLPDRESMYLEVEKWTAQGNSDTLEGLCNSCVYKTFDMILAQECRMCAVRKGLVLIRTENRRQKIAVDRLFPAA